MLISKRSLVKLLPITLIIVAIITAMCFRLDQYFTFASLKQHHKLLAYYVANNYFLSVICFMAIYIVSVSISLPGASFLTIVGGYLFGVTLGTIYVVFSATIGATFLFTIVQYSLGDFLLARAGKWVKKMQHGFQENAFQYLLFLRLVPAFPFWIVNIVPGVLNIKTSTFILATMIGIIPGSFVYVTVGNGLEHILATTTQPDMSIIFSPQILIPILGLAILSILPTLIKKRTKRS